VRDGSSAAYDLVVMACGVNSHLLSRSTAWPRRTNPRRSDDVHLRVPLGRDVIRQTLGQAMHVFLLDIPNLKFAALVPKGTMRRSSCWATI